MAKDVLGAVSSYTEYSVSGGGLHIIARSTEQFEGGKRGDFEIYHAGRFFVFTGNILGDKPTEIRDRTEEIKPVYARYMPHKAKTEAGYFQRAVTMPSATKQHQNAFPATLNGTLGGVELSDEQIVEIAMAAWNGAKFAALWRGDISAFPSYSEADLAFCNMLAFYTGKDETTMDRLFHRSGLYAAEGRAKKWDERHGGETYGAMTIRKAVNNCREVYKPKNPNKKKKAAGGTASSAIFVRDNCYCINRGEDVKTLTNFIFNPLSIVTLENDSRVTGSLHNNRGQAAPRTIRISDFNSVSAFREAVYRNDMNFIVTCSDTELQYMKDFIARIECFKKRGVRGVRIEFEKKEDGGNLRFDPVFVCKEGAFGKDFAPVYGLVQATGSENLACDIFNTETLDRSDLLACGKHYVNYNEKPKTLCVLGWSAACFVKPHLKRHGVKFPNLIMYGEYGSGKSTTYKQFISPFFSTDGAPPISKMTGFTFLNKVVSSNCIPMAFDEYKPSTLPKPILNEFHNAMRDIYDGEHGERGKADQTVRRYEIAAPLCVMGEEAPFEPAIHERSIILQFSKADIAGRKEYGKILADLSTMNVMFGKALTRGLGKSVLNTALGFSSHKVKAAYNEILSDISDALDLRVLNNIAVVLTGIWFLEQTCFALGTTFEEAFGIDRESVKSEVIKAVKDYTLDGAENSKGVVENSLEVMDRMVPSVLKAGYHFKLCDKDKIALHFKRIYDEFTEYVRSKAIAGEYVDFNNFKAQIRKKAYFHKYMTARFKSDVYGG